MSLPLGPAIPFRAPIEVARTSSPRRLAMAVAALFALTSVFAFASPSRAFGWDAESFSASSEADLVTLTNRSRANAGLPALKVDSALTSVARWRSKDMIERDYFSHSIPGYGKVWDKLAAVGYCYKLGGENIGWNNYPDDIATGAIHQMFMDSAGHRENILGEAWDHIGVGAYKGPTGKKMWTVLFADKCGTSAAPKATAKPKPKPKPTAKPAARSTPRPTPRPAAKPTAKAATAVKTAAPAPEPTPEPTVALVVAPTPIAPPDGTDLTPPVVGSGPVPAAAGTTEPTPSPSQDPGGDTGGNGTAGMRVVDRGGTDGLLESIVGGVSGLFFGG